MINGNHCKGLVGEEHGTRSIVVVDDVVVVAVAVVVVVVAVAVAVAVVVVAVIIVVR